jgi:hypothetical protein
VARQARLTESYDWIVLGDSIPALLSGALVARMGLSVLLVGDGAEKKWRLSSNGQVIDPEPNHALGIGHPDHRLGLAGKCLQALRLPDADWASVIVESPIFQAITPRYRAGFHSDLDATLRSAVREAGGKESVVRGLVEAIQAGAEPLRRFWSALPERLTLSVQESPSGTSSSASATPLKRPPAAVTSEAQFRREFLQELPRNPLVHAWGESSADLRMLGATESEREWIDAWLAGAFGGELPEQVAPFDVLQALALAVDGVRFRGGVSAFRASLLRLLTRLGAHIVEAPVGVNRLFVEEGKVLGIQLSGAENIRNVTRARGLISSIHPDKLRGWMEVSDSRPSRDALGTDALRVTLALTVSTHAIPVGMARRVLWKESGAPTLELERAVPSEYGFPLEGREYLFIRACFPVEAESWSVERWRTICERMFRQAAEVLPFLEQHVEKVFPDFRGPEFAKQWNEFYGSGRLSSADVFRVPVASPPKGASARVEGLFEVHRMIAPHLGSMAEWSESLHATAWIAHRSGLAGPLG